MGGACLGVKPQKDSVSSSYSVKYLYRFCAQKLSAETMKMVEKAFDSFDIDRSKAIDLQEAINHWSK